MSTRIRDSANRRLLAVAAVLALTIACTGLLSAGAESRPVAAGAAEDRQSSASSVAASGEPATRSGRRSRRLYWGAWIGDQLTGTAAPFDMRAVAKFERIAAKRLSVVHFSSPFADCTSRPCSFFAFPGREMGKIRRHGAIPMLSWGSQAIPGGPSQRAFQLRDVAAGRYDRYIGRFARAVKRWGHPFFLRFNWEMNGDWFTWGVGANRNRPGQYVPAWRHVHRIFSRVGANNATWVWCPYVDPTGKDNLRRLYPGRAYVDWTCLDGYNWGPRSPANPRPWMSFGELFRSTYRRIVTKVAPRKPMILAEIASSDYGGSKAGWIRNMLAKLPRRYPKVRGFVWFNVRDRGAGWPIESSRAVKRTFRRGINRRVYRPNRFAKITRNPIRPPG